MSRTTKEALIAEMLGDLDALLSRVEKLPAMMGEVEESSLQKQREILQNFVKASERFDTITARSVDDFVAVANEALSKFMQRTTEIKSSLDGLTVPAPTVVAPTASVVSTGEASSSLLWWFVPTGFIVGVLVGVLLMLLLK